MKTLRIILSIILALVGFILTFNESGEFFWNFVGLACFALLMAINIDKETLEKIQR